MDAFYASVEQRDDPTLRKRPVGVGGSPEGRGVICSASYEARKFGVRSAMSARRALKLCPGLVFVRPNFTKYKEASRKIRGIFFDVTDLVEPLSLDEAYLDVTQNKLGQGSATAIAILIRDRIKKELSLTASAGVAPNKFLAKLASDLHKPDGLCVIPPHRVAIVLEKLPVEKLWGVGPATANRLHQSGYFTTADLRGAGEISLARQFGKMGSFLFKLAHGIDLRPVRFERDPKSRGAETTFSQDVIELEKLEQTLAELSEGLAKSLEHGKYRGKTVTVKVRYSDFSTVTRSKTLLNPTASESEIASTGISLLRATEAGKRPVRLVGISLHQFLNENDPEQLLMDLSSF